MREKLTKVDGQRMRFTATVERFGTKRAFRGPDLQTILLSDVRFADTKELACDHLWFTCGQWSLGLAPGMVFAFDARVDSYTKGYQGSRAEALGVSSYSVDQHLERPTNIEILGADEAAKRRNEDFLAEQLRCEQQREEESASRLQEYENIVAERKASIAAQAARLTAESYTVKEAKALVDQNMTREIVEILETAGFRRTEELRKKAYIYRRNFR